MFLGLRMRTTIKTNEIESNLSSNRANIYKVISTMPIYNVCVSNSVKQKHNKMQALTKITKVINKQDLTKIWLLLNAAILLHNQVKYHNSFTPPVVMQY